MKPILFNTDMVRALLDGRKTVTRRVVKPQPSAVYFDGKVYNDDGLYVIARSPNGRLEQIGLPYRPGDTLYVRETFTKYQTVNYIKCHDGRAFSEVSDGQFAYKADGYESIDDLKDDIRLLSDCSFEAVEMWGDKWRPSIHMPREAARIFLRVTDVRVERLQGIGHEGIAKEGIVTKSTPGSPERINPFYAFKELWDSVIKPADRTLYGWAADPWVWVIEFEQCEKP